MPVEHMWYERWFIQQHGDRYFVFGDNLVRRGKGGQARECRNEPNAIGIVTKGLPYWDEKAFLRDADLHIWRKANSAAFTKIEQELADDKTVFFPLGGLGTGRAELQIRAPLIWEELQRWLDKINANL